MSLVSRLTAVFTAIGTDVKTINTNVTALQARTKVIAVPVGDALPPGTANGDIVVRY